MRRDSRALVNKQEVNGKGYFWKGLIVLQFTLATGLVIASCVYYNQMKFISSKDLGYNPHDLIRIHLPAQRTNTQVIKLFRDELLMNPGIDKVASVLGISKGMVIANKKELVVKTNSIDDNYLSTLEIPIIEGRNFYPQSAADFQGRLLGW